MADIEIKKIESDRGNVEMQCTIYMVKIRPLSLLRTTSFVRHLSIKMEILDGDAQLSPVKQEFSQMPLRT